MVPRCRLKLLKLNSFLNYIFSCGLLVVNFAHVYNPAISGDALQVSRDLKRKNSPAQSINTNLESYHEFYDPFTINNKC